MSQTVEATAVAQNVSTLTCLDKKHLPTTINVLQFAQTLYQEQVINQLFTSKKIDTAIAVAKNSFYVNVYLNGLLAKIEDKENRFYSHLIKRFLLKGDKLFTLEVLHTCNSLLLLNCKESMQTFKDTDFALDYQEFKTQVTFIFKELTNFINAKTK